VQELNNYEIHIGNIIVNQIVTLKRLDHERLLEEINASQISQEIKDLSLKALYRSRMQFK